MDVLIAFHRLGKTAALDYDRTGVVGQFAGEAAPLVPAHDLIAGSGEPAAPEHADYPKGNGEIRHRQTGSIESRIADKDCREEKVPRSHYGSVCSSADRKPDSLYVPKPDTSIYWELYSTRAA